MPRKKTSGKDPRSRASGAGAKEPDGTEPASRSRRRTEDEGNKRQESTVPEVAHGRSIELSLPTQVRAAAERQIFNATGEGIVWAVIGSGIDSRHPHFQRHQNLVLDPPLVHRVFTSSEIETGSDEIAALIDPLGNTTHVAGVIAGELQQSAGLVLRAKLDSPGEKGSPQNQTATFPAISGLAPLCKLVSLNVSDDDGSDIVSNLIEALRWVRELNGNGRKLLIHGATIPVALDWEWGLFACGHTPLCLEVNELVKSGVVVVAPSGNGRLGAQGYSDAMGARAMSILDPGNAEDAITVGSTYGQDPHTFGVSYFSSAGPTWDGRLKPDLVAPGERILSCDSGASSADNRLKSSDVRVALYQELTGTGMASSYLSGVVAALLSARRELIGQPLKVKQLLISTADNLNRDRYMQGHGLVNLRRALTEAGSGGRLTTTSNAKDDVPDQPRPLSESPGVPARPPAAPSPVMPKEDFGTKRFAIALSFPDERRDYVTKVVWELRRNKLPRDKIAYDRFLESELIGPNMSARLQKIYHDDSELIVVFISAEYASKDWCGLEWRAVQDIIKKRQDDAIIPLRFDDTDVPGLFSIDGYIDLRDRDPENIAEIIIERLRANLRKRDAPPR